MHNLIDMPPAGTVSAAQPAGAAGEATTADAGRTGSLSPPAAPDSLMHGRSPAAALAYSQYAGAADIASVAPARVTSEAQRDAGLAARFGPDVALVRAALPSALQGQFVALLLASGDASRAAAATPAAERGPVLSEGDLAKLVSAGLAQDERTASLLVSHLAHDIARFGSAPVAQALHLAHDRIAYATGATPTGAQHARVARREESPQQERRRPRHERPDRPAKPSDAPAAADSQVIYTIEDVVRFGDVTVATHRMASPPPDIERNHA